MDNLDNLIFKNEKKAREYLEKTRWPHGPFCHHCGEAESKNIAKLAGKSHRDGLYQCKSCRKQFTVTVGTLFERSKVPLNKWLLATFLLTSSKKSMSTHQIHRMIGVSYKTAWFMTHRIREAMREPVSPGTMGGEGSTAEVDETYWGQNGQEIRGGTSHKEKILTLVEREGRARSFDVPTVRASTLRPILRDQLHADTVML